jgi:5-methylcytosine-specific restriction endonuclease McrA
MARGKVLVLDESGIPLRWVSQQTAITYAAKSLIAYQIGDDDILFRGGHSRMTGEQSTLRTASIIAVRGKVTGGRNKVPSLNNRELFRRDRYTCGYCAGTFADLDLTREHIVPTSKGGEDSWLNCITACNPCNNKKGSKTLAQMGWFLKFHPYIPSRAESLILDSNSITASQAQYLLAFISPSSRVHEMFDKTEGKFHGHKKAA